MADKEPVEWIVREGRFATEVETRYKDGTRSRDAVNNFDQKGKERLLEKQLRGDADTEEWDKSQEDYHMTKSTSGVVKDRVKDR